MNDAIAKLFGPLLCRFFPPSGRRRAAARADVARERPEAVPAVRRPRVARVTVVRGEATRLVRPYLVAYERAHGLEAVA
ncbi:hypothetical protein [Streptomyces sp. NPDC048637]|uniref:hypothetical protein n=1 Tax=Streptomyces sp. NPDC048637 TaxID=3155636 RepID=UPI0034443FA8